MTGSKKLKGHVETDLEYAKRVQGINGHVEYLEDQTAAEILTAHEIAQGKEPLLERIEKRKEAIIYGRDIESIRTLGSMYDNNSVHAILKDGTECRIDANVLLEMAKGQRFVGLKARKYVHLKTVSLENLTEWDRQNNNV